LRQIVLDTETTGLEPGLGHRIIEIGCVEVVNRRATGRHFHHYLNPEREIDAGAAAVHGMTLEKLKDKPLFSQVAAAFLEFVDGAELVIHNAAFDVAFLDAELKIWADRLSVEAQNLRSRCSVFCTLSLAREMHPGQRNGLDALCKRYAVDNSHRQLHGALLDARILTDVYLAMTRAQNSLALDEVVRASGIAMTSTRDAAAALLVIEATVEECAAHDAFMQVIRKASGGR
jgi:DNA polymerase III subunit epsilon